jgi:hypothetical protein
MAAAVEYVIAAASRCDVTAVALPFASWLSIARLSSRSGET